MAFKGVEDLLDYEALKSHPQFGESLRWSDEKKEKSADETVKAFIKSLNKNTK